MKEDRGGQRRKKKDEEGQKRKSIEISREDFLLLKRALLYVAGHRTTETQKMASEFSDKFHYIDFDLFYIGEHFIHLSCFCNQLF